MSEKTSEEMVKELYQAVVGIKDNPGDNGLIGDIRDISKKLDIVNGRTRANEIRSKVNQAIIGITILGAGGGITKIMDLW